MGSFTVSTNHPCTFQSLHFVNAGRSHWAWDTPRDHRQSFCDHGGLFLTSTRDQDEGNMTSACRAQFLDSYLTYERFIIKKSDPVSKGTLPIGFQCRPCDSTKASRRVGKNLFPRRTTRRVNDGAMAGRTCGGPLNLPGSAMPTSITSASFGR